ncbi:hypothetical protein BAE44_0005178, partial [Dichanthelium oligosanthes]
LAATRTPTSSSAASPSAPASWPLLADQQAMHGGERSVAILVDHGLTAGSA